MLPFERITCFVACCILEVVRLTSVEVTSVEIPSLVVFPSPPKSTFASPTTNAPTYNDFHSPIYRPPSQEWIEPRPGVTRSAKERTLAIFSWCERGGFQGSEKFRDKRSHRGHESVKETESLQSSDEAFAGSMSLQRIKAKLGSDVFLPCSTSTNMASKWFHGPRQITSGGKHVVNEEGLQIRETEVEDSGEYECRVGGRATHFQLIFQHPPSIKEVDVPKRIIRGQDVSIRCEVITSAPVQFQWAKEQKVSEMVRVKKKLQAREDHLNLSDVTSDDEGRYFCSVSNHLGSDEKSAKVRVLYPPEVRSLKDRVMALANTSVEVVCEVDGVPEPSIVWTLSTVQGSTLHSTEDLMKHGLKAEVNKGQGRIRINSVNKFMTGNLTCTANNEAGSSSGSTFLLVEHEPTALVSPSVQFGWAGETRRFKCSSVSWPPSTLSWFHDERFIGRNDHHEHVAGHVTGNYVESVLTLTIPDKSSWIYGNYTCIAKNIHGHSTGVIQLIQAFVPEAPGNISIIEETPNEVTITAESQPGPLQPISWSVSYEELRSPAKQQLEIFPYGKHITLKNLRPSTEYTVHLALRNAVGYGQSTKFKLFTPSKDSFSGWRHSMDSSDRIDVSDASFFSAPSDSELNRNNHEFESKFSSIKKPRKKSSNLETSVVWAVVTGLVLAVASSITTACLCTAWRQKYRKSQNAHDLLSLRGQINSPIPPNSILLVPVSSSDENGQPMLTNDDVETLASELASLSHETPIKSSETSFGTFPRHLKHSREKLQCFSPVLPPASTIRTKNGDVVDIFGTQFRKIQPETIGTAQTFTPTKKAHNFIPIILESDNERRRSKRSIPASTLRNNSTNENFSTCGGYESADNVDDDIDGVGCNTPCHQQFHSNRTFPAKSSNSTFTYVRSMSHLK